MKTTLTHTDLKGLVSSDDHYPAFTGVYLDVDRGHMVATDGMVLALIPVEIEDGDESAIIPIEAFDHRPLGITKRDIEYRHISVRADEVTVSAPSAGVLRPRLKYPTINERFPDYWAIVERAVRDAKNTTSGVSVLGLNLNYAIAITKALPKCVRHGIVSMHFSWADKAIVIKPVEPEYRDWTFLCMPYKLNDYSLDVAGVTDLEVKDAA